MSRKIGFIGAGNMASAILGGILQNSVEKAQNLYIYDPDLDKLNRFVQKGVNACQNEVEAVEQSDVLFFCVKPQAITDVLPKIRTAAQKNPGCLYVSIMAAITTAYIKQELGFDAKVIRLMPNTPLLIGQGATALSYDAQVTQEEFTFVRDLFSKLGAVAVIPEDKMDAVIPVNGSSPAFVYLFIKTMVDQAVENGIAYNAALDLACATFIGSANMVLQSGKTPQELIDMVSSKGGTTLAALAKFEECGLTDAYRKGMEASIERSKELSR